MLKLVTILGALVFLASLPISLARSSKPRPYAGAKFTETHTLRACPRGIYCDEAPEDETRKVYDDGCGSYDWDLKAEYGEEEYDEGVYTSYGTCNGGYLSCACA
jgi:hypothetical protein